MEGGIVGTILGSVLGFLASLLPDVFGIVRDHFAPQKQPTIYNPNQYDGQVVAEGEPAPAAKPPAEHPLPDDLRTGDAPLHYKVLDVLRASVRPVLTYAFFTLFAYIKLNAMYYAFHADHTRAVDLLPILWDEGTEALFAAVLSFWFGSRAM